MLYLIYQYFFRYYATLRLFSYVNFRAMLAIIIGFFTAIVLGRKMIMLLFKMGFVDYSRKYYSLDSLTVHSVVDTGGKKGTVQMGGIIFILSALISSLICADLSNRFIHILLFSLIWFAAIGLLDDYSKIKIYKDADKGIVRATKLLLQGIFSLLLTIFVCWEELSPYAEGSNLEGAFFIPFMRDPVFYLPLLLYFPVILFFVWVFTNGVNLTDGMDGLLSGSSIFTFGVFGIYAYILGHLYWSDYLKFYWVMGASEISVFAAAFLGSLIGFLWYNSYPAQIFMGDSGSLAIGGVIVTIAVLIKQEMLLFLAGFLFFIEMFSSFVQDQIGGVNNGGLNLGQRILYRAPLHDHFRYKGYSESNIVVKLWIIAGLFSAIAMLFIKIR